MRLAQLVKFRVKDNGWNDIVKLVESWHKNHAKETDGLIDTYIWRNTRSGGECGALVIFEGEESLTKFSNTSSTVAFFEKAKSYMKEEPDYFHVELLSGDFFSVKGKYNG